MVEELTIDIGGCSVFLRRADAPAGAPQAAEEPVLYLHSVPTSSDDWLGLLPLTGGFAPDLPGFGRSDKGGHLDLTLGAQARVVIALLDALDLPRVSVVAHGWGATAALLATARAPERVARMVLIDVALPPQDAALPPLAQRLRRAVLGELLMGSVNRRLLGRLLRRASADAARAWPDAALDDVWAQFDQGTQRAILRLLRSADPAALDGARAAADRVRAPALVLWGADDPWSPVSWGGALAQRLPAASLELVGAAGHWPWREQPAVGERIVRWLADPTGG